MKKLVTLLLALMMILGMTCVSAEEQDPVNIVFWHTYGEGELAALEEYVMPAFAEEYPWITVEVVAMPYDQLKQQVIMGVASGTAPDLMRMDIIWVPEFAAMGALVAVDELEGFAELKDQFFPGPLSTNYYGGHYYGLPLNTNTKTGIWNKAMMEKLGLTEPPATYDELIALADKLGEGEYLIASDGANTWGLAPYFYSLGGSYTDPEVTKATGYMNSPESVAAIETIVKWYDEGIMAPSVLGGEPDKNTGLFNDLVLVGDEGPWMFTGNTEEDLAHVEAGLLPAGPAGSLSVVGGENLVMFESGANNEAAWIFAQFLMGDYSQTIMATKGGLVPTIQHVAESEEVSGSSYIAAYTEQLSTAVARTPSPIWEKMSDKVGNFFASALRHEITDYQAALDELAAEVDVMIAEANAAEK